VETARDYAIFTMDPDGRIESWFGGAQDVLGWTAEEMVGQPVEITFTPEDNEAGVPAQERAIAAAEGSAPNVRWHVGKDGKRVFIDGIAAALRGAEGELLGFLKIGQDTTERRRAEEHQKMLLGELQHRVRNTLGVIRSIGRRTAEMSGSVDEMWSHLQGRIDAFSRVQSAVTRNPDAGVDLETLIADELHAHAAREGERVRIGGPELLLKPRAAETLSLAIHELATNAVKYGALSVPIGMLSVTWRRELGRLELLWEEGGLHDLSPTPERQGFGLELLQRSLPYELDAETRIEFRPHGLRFSLSVPLGPSVLAG
jgi:PAS domain S-box-containing protein